MTRGPFYGKRSALGVLLAYQPCIIFFLRFPGPWVSFGLFPFSCSVVFGFRSSPSLGVPFSRFGFTGFGFLVVLVLVLACAGWALDSRWPVPSRLLVRV